MAECIARTLEMPKPFLTKERFLVLRALVAVLLLSWSGSVSAAVWYPLDPPRAGETHVLDTLLMGDHSWVAYATAGMARYDDQFQLVRHLTRASGLPSDTVTCLARDGQAVWAGTSDGLARVVNDQVVKVLTTRDGLPDNGITCLAQDGSFLWVGTLKGLLRLDGEMFHLMTEEHGLPTNHITALYAGPKGLYVGTTLGWALVRNCSVMETHRREERGLPFEWITSFAFYRNREFTLEHESSTDDEVLVLGTAGGGLLRWYGGHYTSFNDDEEALSTWITDLAFEPETKSLWVGSQKGVSVYSVPEKTWSHYTEENSGLTSNGVTSLQVAFDETVYHDYELLTATGGAELASRTTSLFAADVATATATASATEAGAIPTVFLPLLPAASGVPDDSAQDGESPVPNPSVRTEAMAGSPTALDLERANWQALIDKGIASQATLDIPTATARLAGAGECECPLCPGGTCGPPFYPPIPRPHWCPICWHVPRPVKPRKVRISTTRALIGTQDRAHLYFHK